MFRFTNVALSWLFAISHYVSLFVAIKAKTIFQKQLAPFFQIESFESKRFVYLPICIFNKLDTVLEILEDLINTSSEFVSGIECLIDMIGSTNTGVVGLN